MKIAISATGKDVNSLLDLRFGRCEYFQIYDTLEKEFEVVENKGQLSGGGAGIAAANQIIEEKVDVIITGSLGPNAFKLIEKSGTKAYKCSSVSINSAIEQYTNGKLEEINFAGPAHNGMGHL